MSIYLFIYLFNPFLLEPVLQLSYSENRKGVKKEGRRDCQETCYDFQNLTGHSLRTDQSSQWSCSDWHFWQWFSRRKLGMVNLKDGSLMDFSKLHCALADS